MRQSQSNIQNNPLDVSDVYNDYLQNRIKTIYLLIKKLEEEEKDFDKKNKEEKLKNAYISIFENQANVAF